MKLNKIGGEEETILKHEVKAREKNHLTNKNPILATKALVGHLSGNPNVLDPVIRGNRFEATGS